ncbi:MAG: sigma-54-dependent transcriptional regulator [Bdellovibrionota bacterium]
MPLVPLLVVDDDSHIHTLLDKILRGEAYEVSHAKSPEEALQLAAANSFMLALVDLHFAGSGVTGFTLLDRLRELDPQIEPIVMSSSSRFEDVRGAMRAGAGDYLPKGFGKGELLHSLERALERRRWKKMEKRVRAETRGRALLVGEAVAMRELKDKIAKFAPTDAPVLITGETGTGKELVAASLHAGGADPSAPFVAVNCAALPASTIDSFFFGHERGAFTGADQARGGVFEEAEGGTLFLDEVNSLPLELQGRLLRVLQERKARRLGGSREIPVDFRLVTASNQDLETLVQNGTFREDLFFRVSVLRLGLPPLRNRLEDLPTLTASLLPGRELEPGLWEVFRGHSWPGNVRELRNLLQALDVLAPPDDVLRVEYLPENALRSFTRETEGPADLQGFVNERESREREFLGRAYRSARGNISAMARTLNLDRSHLHQKLVKLGIHAARG